jgi:hypothetical protein
MLVEMASLLGDSVSQVTDPNQTAIASREAIDFLRHSLPLQVCSSTPVASELLTTINV